jgi:branched-chain amino acid transport system substrate-binding protein
MSGAVLDSRALTKIQSASLIAIIVFAAVIGSAAYAFWLAPASSTENIKIGLCADLDNTIGKGVWQAAILAAEQVNAKGGVLGRNFTIVAEDDDDEAFPSADATVTSNAMTRLITVDKADFVISDGIGTSVVFPHQDICADHKTIMFGVRGTNDNFTQRVLDNYDRYKYFFKLSPSNSSTVAAGMLGDMLTVGNYTGFTKIAFLGQDSTTVKQILAGLNSSLPKYGFDIVYSGLVSVTTTDFTSNFAAIEASGAQILVPIIVTQASVSFVKEWYERQSPTVVWGILSGADQNNFWDLTEGKCEYTSFSGYPAAVGYPLTNKTVQTREDYLERWGAIPSMSAVTVYDGVRFILPDALKRAGTTETEAVIKALETTNIETSTARHFVFTSSHDIMIGTGKVNNPAADYVVVCYFQWQTNRTLAPVKPEEMMKEAGVTYRYPPWQGPWSEKQSP